MATGRGMGFETPEYRARLIKEGSGAAIDAIKEADELMDYGTIHDETGTSLLDMDLSGEHTEGDATEDFEDEEAADESRGSRGHTSPKTLYSPSGRVLGTYSPPKHFKEPGWSPAWKPPDFEQRLGAGSRAVLQAMNEAHMEEDDEGDAFEDLSEDERAFLENIDDLPLPEDSEHLYEGLQQGIHDSLRIAHRALDAGQNDRSIEDEQFFNAMDDVRRAEAIEGMRDVDFSRIQEGASMVVDSLIDEKRTSDRLDAEAIAAGYAALLNSINEVQEKMPDGEYNANIGPLLNHHYADETGGAGQADVSSEEESSVDEEAVAAAERAAAAAAERENWKKNLAGRDVHVLWTEGQKRDLYVQSLQEDTFFLMDKQRMFAHENATAHDELDLQDLQMTFIKMTIANGRRRYLLPLSLQIKKSADQRIAQNDHTNYKPLIQVLVLGYFFPEFYRDYDNRERQREVITFKRKYLGSLDILTKAAMQSDPSIRQSAAVREKWRAAMETATDELAVSEIADEIREQALFAAEEALMEQNRWGPAWLEEIGVLVDTAIYNAKVPNVRGKKFSLVPVEGTGIGDVVLQVVEEAMDGRIGMEEASAAIKAVLNVLPEVFQANPNPEMAAAPIAAALQAALAVVQEGPVSAALQEGDIASALNAVKGLQAIQDVPSERVAVALQSVLEEVHNASFGHQQVKARAALRSIAAALGPPDQADHQVAGQVLEAVANVAANAAAQGAAIAIANISLEGADRPAQEDIQAAVGDAAQAAAGGAVLAISEAALQGALGAIAGGAAPNSPGVNRNDIAHAVVDAAHEAAPQAVADAQHMAQNAVQPILQHAAAAVGFHIVTREELLELPAEEQEALHKTAQKVIQLGRNDRPDSIVQALLKEVYSSFGLQYVEKLMKTIFGILADEEKFLPGIGSVLVTIHRFMMLRRKKRLPKRTLDNYEDIPIKEGRVEMDKIITAVVVATQRGAKGEAVVDKHISDAYQRGGRLFIEHLYMGLAWDQKQKTIIPGIYNTMKKIHDFILME